MRIKREGRIAVIDTTFDVIGPPSCGDPPPPQIQSNPYSYYYHCKDDIRKGDGTTAMPYKAYYCRHRAGKATLWSPISQCFARVEKGEFGNDFPLPGVANAMLPNFTVSHGSFASMISCRAAALSKLQQTKLEIGIELAQVRSTANFIGTTLRDLASIFRAVKTGKLSERARILLGYRDNRGRLVKRTSWNQAKDLSSRWLEAQFAAKPLMALVSDACDRITNRVNHPTYGQFYVSAKAKRNQKARVTVPNTVLPPPPDHNYCDWQVERFFTVQYRCRVTNPSLFFLSSVGLGPRDVWAVLWDIVPWSFVIDWFIPIGRWLKNYAVQQGLVVGKGSYETIFIKGNYTYSHAISRSNLKRTSSGSAACVSRQGTSFSLSQPRYREDWFNAWTITTAAALIRQQLT